MAATGKDYSSINGDLYHIADLFCGHDQSCQKKVDNCMDRSITFNSVNNHKYLNGSRVFNCFEDLGFTPKEIEYAIFEYYPKQVLCGKC